MENTKEGLNALLNDLEKNAFNEYNTHYEYKEANRIIEKHFEKLVNKEALTTVSAKAMQGLCAGGHPASHDDAYGKVITQSIRLAKELLKQLNEETKK